MIWGSSLQSVPCGLWEHLPAKKEKHLWYMAKNTLPGVIQHAYTAPNEEEAICSIGVSGPLYIDSALSSHASTNFTTRLLTIFWSACLRLFPSYSKACWKCLCSRALSLKYVLASKGNELFYNKRLAIMWTTLGFQELPYNYVAQYCMSEVCFIFNILWRNSDSDSKSI